MYTARVILSQLDTLPVDYENACEKISFNFSSGKWDNTLTETMEEKAEEKIAVYPNPALAELNVNIQLPDTEKGYFTIYNLAQQKITSYQLLNGTNKLAIHSLAPGVYIYEIETNNEIMRKDKLVIIR